MNKDSEIGSGEIIFQTEKLTFYGAAAWAFVFAVLHFVWAAGFYIFLPENLASKAFAQRWFLIYDLAAGFSCLIGAVMILYLAYSFGDKSFRAGVKFLMIVGTVILVLRAIAGIGKFLYVLLQKQSLAESISFWDLWFCLGAGLFALSLSNVLRRRQ